jgi:Rrf2 family protein
VHISARADYAVRACLELAKRPDQQLSAEAVAMYADLPGKFLEAILVELRRAGIVRTQRGPKGGCLLARPAETITIAEVVEAIDDTLGTVRGEAPDNLHYPDSAAALQVLWISLAKDIRLRLSGVTLHDLTQDGVVHQLTQDHEQAKMGSQ